MLYEIQPEKILKKNGVKSAERTIFLSFLAGSFIVKLIYIQEFYS